MAKNFTYKFTVHYHSIRYDQLIGRVFWLRRCDYKWLQGIALWITTMTIHQSFCFSIFRSVWLVSAHHCMILSFSLIYTVDDIQWVIHRKWGWWLPVGDRSWHKARRREFFGKCSFLNNYCHARQLRHWDEGLNFLLYEHLIDGSIWREKYTEIYIIRASDLK